MGTSKRWVRERVALLLVVIVTLLATTVYDVLKVSPPIRDLVSGYDVEMQESMAAFYSGILAVGFLLGIFIAVLGKLERSNRS